MFTVLYPEDIQVLGSFPKPEPNEHYYVAVLWEGDKNPTKPVMETIALGSNGQTVFWDTKNNRWGDWDTNHWFFKNNGKQELQYLLIPKGETNDYKQVNPTK